MRRLACALIAGTIIGGFAPQAAAMPDAAAAAPSSAPDKAALRAVLAAQIPEIATRERAEKQIPALALAVVDDTGVIWSGVWSQDGKATERTFFRAGSVTKTLVSLAAQQLVDEGRLDLDAPVGAYLPDFRPGNPFGQPPTVRQLMSHTAGLVREPPVGNYFDASGPSLAATVRSLNRTRLLSAPGARYRYSNAGYAVVGRVLEAASGKPWDALLAERVFAPAGMASSRLRRGDGDDVAAGQMASFDAEPFAAPTFELGEAPAGGLYTNLEDLGRLAQHVLRAARGQADPVATPAGVARMMRRETPAGDTPYGLGASLVPLDGHRQLAHGGAIYGHVTAFRVLPDDNLAVVAFSASDAGPTAERLAKHALRLALATRTGRPADPYVTTERPTPETARRLEGRYAAGDETLNLRVVGGRLLLDAPRLAGELRRSASGWCVDDALTFDCGVEIAAHPGVVRLGATDFARALLPASPPPAPAPEVATVVGEYGFEHNILRIYERDGGLFARTEWSEFAPLTRQGPDLWAYPDRGVLYAGEAVRFVRGKNGRVVAAELGGVRFPRRDFGAEAEGRLRRVVRGDAGLLARARQMTPPAAPGATRAPDLVPVTQAVPGARLDVRYATADNFMGVPVYARAAAFLQRPAAEALARVQAKLADEGYGLLVHDAYRPWFVTRAFWDATPAEGKAFVADPVQGSRHNRGGAVDLTLFEAATGQPVSMPGRYDEMSARSYPQFVGGTDRERWFRDRLRAAMEAEGFEVTATEWWHFDHRDWPTYPILNTPFEDLSP